MIPSWKRAGALVLSALYINVAVAQSSDPILPNTVNCTLTQSQVCVDSTPCKTVGPYNVCLQGAALPNKSNSINTDQTCWEYQSTYTCLQRTNDCLSLQSTPGCTEQAGSPVCGTDASGNPMVDPKYGCTNLTHTYQCSSQSGGGGSGTSNPGCTTSVTIGGLNWSATNPSAASDFLLATVYREIQNQAGSAIQSGLSLFKGEVDKCVIKIGGLKNCCQGGGNDASSGSNFNIASTVGFSVGGAALSYGGQYASYEGSKWVYDALVNNGGQEMASKWALNSGLQFEDSGAVAGFSGGVGAMGFGSTAAAAEGLTGTIGGSAVTSSTMMLTSEGGWVAAGAELGPGVSPVLYFNPYALAAAVAIQVTMQLVMTYLSCDQASQNTVNLVSKNICHYVGSYCSSSLNLGFTKICLETSQSYCCYNGLLAKDIEIGAHQQLGGTWGSPQSPVCGVYDPNTPSVGSDGLSVGLLTSLNFSAIDMSEFVSQISANVQTLNSNDMATMQNNATKKLGQ